jgi:polyhydroxybutyrate depolymerase
MSRTFLLASVAILVAACSEASYEKPGPAADMEDTDTGIKSPPPEKDDSDPPADPVEDAGTSVPAADAGSRGLSAGCGKAGADKGLFAGTKKIGGKKRDFLRFVPPGYMPNKPLMLVLAFHGSGGDGERARASFKLEAEAAGKAIFIYPSALPAAAGEFAGVPRWQLEKGSEDHQLVDALLDDVQANYCIDRDRIFAAGFSMGARMTSILGCTRGDALRAIAPVAPGGSEDDVKDCVGEVGVWMALGKKDDFHTPATKAIRDHFVTANGCATTTAAVTPAPCVGYQTCKPDLPVVYCEHNEGDTDGHVWPSFAPAGVWKFFNSFK